MIRIPLCYFTVTPTVLGAPGVAVELSDDRAVELTIDAELGVNGDPARTIELQPSEARALASALAHYAREATR